MFADLVMAPSQLRGGFRLVPLLRESPRRDLRLGIGRLPTARDEGTIVYTPHAFVVEWTSDRQPVATLGTRLQTFGKLSSLLHGRRLARRLAGRRVGFLPLRLALDGLLVQHFGGPRMDWGDFSRQALSAGFHEETLRHTRHVTGRDLGGLGDALRTFEIHEAQVGVLVFVAEALAAAFVTPHPHDYRQLHDSLLEDCYGDLIWQYARLHTEEWRWHFSAEAEGIGTLADLRTAIEIMRGEWAAYADNARRWLPDSPESVEHVYDVGPFRLERFIGSLVPGRENHVGERIVDEEGRVQYLKTFRLSEAQVRRAYLLKLLADHDWNVDHVATAISTTRELLLLRYERAGFGWLFHQHVIDAARAHVRRRHR